MFVTSIAGKPRFGDGAKAASTTWAISMSVNKMFGNGKFIQQLSCQINFETIITLLKELYMARKAYTEEFANN